MMQVIGQEYIDGILALETGTSAFTVGFRNS